MGRGSAGEAQASLHPNIMSGCSACHRNESTRLFYCSNCLTKRLADHYTRRQQAQRLCELAQAKALALLEPPPASSAWGVRSEREFKADKWSSAVRAKELRTATEVLQASINADRILLQQRRTSLMKRRENLIKARRLLSTTTTTTNTNIDPEPSSKSTALSELTTTHASLLERSHQVRSILTRELLAVYAFQPLSDSPFTPSTSYALAHLSLPTLSALPTLPQPHLCAILSHLLHLTRLIALYHDLELPFTPLPSLFGPGRPGVRATPSASIDGVRGVGTSSSSSPASIAWPLFLSRTKSTSSGPSLSITDQEDPHGTQTGRIEPYRSSGEGIEASKRLERTKAVMMGAIAIAFDLAWIGVVRSGRNRHRPRRRLQGVQDLDDLAGLIRQATSSSLSASIELDPVGKVDVGINFKDAVRYFIAKMDPSTTSASRSRGSGLKSREEKWSKVEAENDTTTPSEEEVAVGVGGAVGEGEDEWDFI